MNTKLKLAVEDLDRVVQPEDPRPPLRRALDGAASVAVPVAGAVAAGVAGLGKTKQPVSQQIS